MNLNELISPLHECQCEVDIYNDTVCGKEKKEWQCTEAHLEDAPLLPELVVASRLSSSSLHKVLIRRKTLKKRKGLLIFGVPRVPQDEINNVILSWMEAPCAARSFRKHIAAPHLTTRAH